jgi:hypothetical protein
MNPYSRRKEPSLELVMNKIAKRLHKLESSKDSITPRDFYAGMAICGMLSFGETNDRSPKYLAEQSFRIAEAMLEAR